MRKLLFFLSVVAVGTAVIAAVSTVYLYEQDNPFSEMNYMYSTLRREVASPSSENGIDLASLAAQNRDFQGWLEIPGTPISHPVVMGKDNAYYLHNNFLKEPSRFGCLFFDTRSVAGADNRVIYGHNMGQNRQEMFSSLMKYRDPAYADAHSTVYFTDLKGIASRYEVFAVMDFDTRKGAEFDFRNPFFKSEKEYIDFYRFVCENSVYFAERPAKSQPLLTLYTCNPAFGQHFRQLVFCTKNSNNYIS